MSVPPRKNVHHLWWPNRDYTTDIERAFRQLKCQTVEIDFVSHRELHVYTAPPTKPGRGVMLEMIKRHDTNRCSCYEDPGDQGLPEYR